MLGHAPTITLLVVLAVLNLPGIPAHGQQLTIEIVRSAADFDQRTKEPIVSIVLTKESSIALGRFTADRVGHKMEMRRGGQVVVSTVIREPLLGGSFQISGHFSADQTMDIASRLPAGAKIDVEAAPR